MKRNTTIRTILLAISIMCLGVGTAFADTFEFGEEEKDTRMGLTIGVGAGVGHLECGGEYCDRVTEAAGLHAHVGLMLLPFMSVVADFWAMGHTESRLTVTQSMATVGPRVWFVPERLWLGLGIGVSRASYNYDAEIVEFNDSTEWTPAGMAAVGFEVLSGKDLAVDLQLRTGTGFFNEGDTRIYNFSLGAGVSWF